MKNAVKLCFTAKTSKSNCSQGFDIIWKRIFKKLKRKSAETKFSGIQHVRLALRWFGRLWIHRSNDGRIVSEMATDGRIPLLLSVNRVSRSEVLPNYGIGCVEIKQVHLFVRNSHACSIPGAQLCISKLFQQPQRAGVSCSRPCRVAECCSCDQEGQRFPISLPALSVPVSIFGSSHDTSGFILSLTIALLQQKLWRKNQ